MLIAAAQKSVANDDFKAAVVQYKAALPFDLNASETRHLVGMGLLPTGDPAVAVGPAMALGPKIAPDKVLPDLCRALRSNNRTGTAQKYVTEVQRKNPQQAEPFRAVADVQMRAAASDAAIATLRRGMANTKARSNIARLRPAVYVKVGRNAVVDKFAAKLLKAHADDVSVDLNASAVSSTHGDLDRAKVHSQPALANQPNNGEALNNLVWVLVPGGKVGTVAFAQKTVGLTPDQAPLLDTRAPALAADHRLAQAVPLRRRATALCPADSDLHLNLAKIAQQTGGEALAPPEVECVRALGAVFKEQDKLSEWTKVI